MMNIQLLIQSIIDKHRSYGIDVHPPATTADIKLLEQAIGFSLPADFVTMYSVCNGFACTEDMFNITSLADTTEFERNYGPNYFYFAEYEIRSDLWGLRYLGNQQYEIFNYSYPAQPMTHSLAEFLEHFLAGGVFDKGGLYDWQEELGIGP